MTITRAHLFWRRTAATLVALALFLCCFPAPEAALAASDGMVRVRLTRLGARSSLSFTTTCAYYVDGNTARAIPAGAQATVEATGGQLYLTVNGSLTALGASCTLARGEGGARGIRFTSPSVSGLYCGDLMLSVSGGSIVPILRIYIEDYLYGVVGYEMSASWPLEALKAQAVAARNYALRCMSTRSSNAYHMVDTASDQVFRGYEGSSSVIRAVDETRNMALYAGSAIASCYYSASNGGQTEATRNVWGGNLSYSTVKDDPYDLANPSATVKTAAIRRDATGLDERLMQALRQGAGGAEIAAILDIEPHSPKYAAPSRLYTKLRFTVETADARQFSVDVDTYGALEAWYGLSINSSSNETVYVEESADGFTIAFRRWGHGVGMSQRGAQTMAQRGMSFRDILSFYYPGTQLRTLSLTDTTGSGLHDGGATDTPLGQVVCLSGATLHESASTASAAVANVPAGALVNVYQAGTEWSYLGYGGLRGWGQTALFALPGATATPAPTSVAGRRAVVTMAYEDGRLYLRSGPSTDTPAVTTVRHGDVVTACAETGEWTAVETARGQRGYLKSKYLVYEAEPTLIPITPSPSPSPSPAPTATLLPWPTASASPAPTATPPWATAAPSPSATATPTPTATPSPTASPTEAPTATPSPAPTASATPLAERPYGAFARVAYMDGFAQLTLQAGPALDAAPVAPLADGDYVEILHSEDGWARVQTRDGDVGYVQEYYLRRLDGIVALPSATAATPTPAPTVSDVPLPTPTPAPTATPTNAPQSGSLARVALSSASSRLNLRSSPSTSAAIAGKLAHGEIVRVLAANGTWVRVETSSGLTGFVQSRYLTDAGNVTMPAATPAPTATPTNAPAGDGMTALEGEVYADIYVSASGGSLHVRQGPSTQTPSVTTVSHGSWVQVLAVGGEWAHVRTRRGNEGYLKTKYLIRRDAAPGESASAQGAVVQCDLRAVAAQNAPAHAAPAHGAALVATIPAGTPLYVKAYNDEWARVVSVSGSSSGYVLKAHLRSAS